MPSSAKTGIVGLNQWTESDRPKRADFNADNMALETHIASIESALGQIEIPEIPQIPQTAGDIGAVTLVNGKAKAEQTSAAIVRIVDSEMINASEAGKLLVIESTAPITLTLPSNNTAAIPIGTEIELLQLKEGAVTIAAEEGVTLHSLDDMRGLVRYMGAALKKLDANIWWLAGGITDAE